MTRLRGSIWPLLILGALLASACGGPSRVDVSDSAPGSAPPGDAEPLEVAVTVAPLAWIVASIGGEHVRVQVAVAPGESPETFQPTDAMASRLLRAQLYFSVGVPAENGPWFDAVASRMEVVDLRAEPAPSDAHHHGDGAHRDHDAHGHDPHAWLSPARLEAFAERIASALTEADPARAEAYGRGLDVTKTRLLSLDQELRAMLDLHRGRTFLIFHPAWGHFAEDYGLVQLAVEIDGQSPSDAELTRIRRAASEHRCGALFVQPQISDRNARRLGDSLGIPVEVLDPLDRDLPATLRAAAQALAASFQLETAP